nr:MAG TPA: hypothetical protein [Caudoviricetes sp.]
MKVNITYSCGHEGTIEAFGKAEERERKIKYFEEYGLCPDCYKEGKKGEEKAFAEKYELPELQGSEKQISWAESIRKEKIEAFEKEKPAIRKGAGDDFAEFLNEFADKYYKNNSASWWIDHREWRTFKKELLKEAVTTFKAQDAR